MLHYRPDGSRCKHRYSVLERYAETPTRISDFRKQYTGKPPVAVLKKLRKDDPNAWAIFSLCEYLELGGGPLGVIMNFEGNLEPGHHQALELPAKSSDKELRASPPIRVFDTVLAN